MPPWWYMYALVLYMAKEMSLRSANAASLHARNHNGRGVGLGTPAISTKGSRELRLSTVTPGTGPWRACCFSQWRLDRDGHVSRAYSHVHA